MPDLFEKMTKKGNSVVKTDTSEASGIQVHCRDCEIVDLADLVPYPGNPNKHSDEQVALLAKIIRARGWRHPVIVSTFSGRVVAGHGRIEAARLLGVATVPVERQAFASEAEEREFLLSDNRIAELAERDNALLKDLLEQLDTGETDMDLTGYTAEVIESLMLQEHQDGDADAEPQVDRAAELAEKWGVNPGDLWLIGDHRLLCGDSTKAEAVARVMGGAKWELCVTSPPYNQNIANFSKSGMHKETKWIDQTRAGAYEDNKPEDEYRQWQQSAVCAWITQCTPQASIFYNHKNRFRDKQCISPWIWLQTLPVKVRQEIIWMREGSVTQNMRGFMPVDERIFWMYIGDDFYFDDTTEVKTFSTVWRINSHKDIGESRHGCEFPLELPSRAMRACSHIGGHVFEPYCGGGTTMVAAQNLNRKCYGIEISPGYCGVILQRMADAFPGIEIRKSDA
jgi:DNA modification methylase